MANSVIQTIRDAEVDARSLSEFISKDAYFTVTRRLAPTIHTLDYYLLVLNKVKDKGDLADIAISDTLDKLEQLEPTVIQRVEDAINNTAVEGGVLADTFVVVDATLNQRQINRGFESIADMLSIANPNNGLRVYVKSYHAGLNKGGGYFTYDSSMASDNDGGTVINGWVRDKGVIDVFQFGAKADGISDDSVAIQKAIDVCTSLGGHKLYVLTGTYYLSNSLILKDGVSLIGDGSGVTVIDIKKGNYPAITTKEPVETALTQTADLVEGDKENSIINTCSPGDLIRFNSSYIFTQRWGDEGRPYYTEGEMLEIETAASDSVVFKRPTFINCSVNTSKNVSYFTPLRNVGLQGVTIKKDKDIVQSGAYGLLLRGVADSFVHDVETLYFDNSGITISKSIRVNLSNTKHVGGSNELGLCYGVGYVDGTRDCMHVGIAGEKCRHLVSAGGTGWALPAYNTVIGIKASNNYISALDTHGNSAFFTYSSIVADEIGYMSGLGHRMTDVIGYGKKSATSRLMVGGKDIHYSNITAYNHSLYSTTAVKDSTFDNIKLISNRFDILAFRTGSTGNTFNNISIICTGASKATSTTEADSYLTANSYSPTLFLAQPGCVLKGFYIEGFPQVLFSYNNVRVDGLTANECGWKSTHTTYNSSIVLANPNNSSFSNVSINTNADKKGENEWGIFVYSPSGQEQNNTALRNISIRNTTSSTRPVLKAFYGTSSILGLEAENIDINARSGTNTIETVASKYINCSFTIGRHGYYYDQLNPITGSSTSRPAAPKFGQVYFDSTLNQPIWYTTAGTWVKADGTIA